ncbi:PKD domain-containing protein [Flavobacterium hauense]
MKKLNLALVLFSLAWLGSCGNDDGNVIDCLGENLFMDVSHTVDTEDPHKISFTYSYNGEKTLDSKINWDYGDGKKETLTGTTATHTYAQPGKYTVKIQPTVRAGGGSCSPELERHITIN